MNSCEVTAYVTALANIISSNFSQEEVAVLAAIFTQLGDTLATALVVKELCESSKTNETV